MNTNVTQETIDLAKAALEEPLAKDATTAGYTTVTGLTGYNLEAPAKSLFPVLSPFRNSTPRTKAPNGAKSAQWKSIMAINVNNARASASFGSAGNLITTKEQDFSALYKVIALGDTVQYDAQIQAQGFQDLRATSGVNALYALMQQEEVIMLGGQNFSLGTPVAPTLVVSTTGGTIGSINLGVVVAVRTMQGYFDGQCSIASPVAASGVMSGATNKVTATATYVPGAVCYDWFVGTNGGTYYYYGTTSVNSIAITSNPGIAASTTGLPMCAIPTYWNASVLTTATQSTQLSADNTIDANAFNGLIATLVGDYTNGSFVQHGTGANCGSYLASLNGAAMTGNNGTINEIDAALASLWANAKLSPTKILMNATDRINASNKMIATGGAYLMFQPDNAAQRQNVVGGQVVSGYINKAVNGKVIPIEVNPWIPQGTIIGITEELPYPNNKVSNVFEVETQLEYQQIEYAVNRGSGITGGPRYDFEVRAQETFKNYFPGAFFMLQNVLNG